MSAMCAVKDLAVGDAIQVEGFDGNLTVRSAKKIKKGLDRPGRERDRSCYQPPPFCFSRQAPKLTSKTVAGSSPSKGRK